MTDDVCHCVERLIYFCFTESLERICSSLGSFLKIQIMDLNLEKNCIVAFQNFLDVLRPTSTELGDAVIELNRIIGRIENLSPKLIALENIEYVFERFEYLIPTNVSNNTDNELFPEKTTRKSSTCIQ